MSTRVPSYRTLRLMCGNAAGMVAFLAAFVLARDPVVALAAGVIVGAIGYAASTVVVDYASGGDRKRHDGR